MSEFNADWWDAQGCPETASVLRQLAVVDEEDGMAGTPVDGELVCPNCAMVGRVLRYAGKTHVAAPPGHGIRGESGGYGDVPLRTEVSCPTSAGFSFVDEPFLSLEKSADDSIAET